MEEAAKIARAVEAWNAYRILVGISLRNVDMKDKAIDHGEIE
jgi:hypothetical protein